jgi:hypothetical protein
MDYTTQPKGPCDATTKTLGSGRTVSKFIAWEIALAYFVLAAIVPFHPACLRHYWLHFMLYRPEIML